MKKDIGELMMARGLALLSETKDINIRCLIKGGEAYIFFYNDAGAGEAIKSAGRFASHPELGFNWSDVDELRERIIVGEPIPSNCFRLT